MDQIPLMSQARVTSLPGRALLSVSGADRVAFLQGLVSNDVTLAAPDRLVWAALLTPQGRWTADFFLFADGSRLLLDCEAAEADAIATRLSRFRLRSDIAIAPEPGFAVHVAWGAAPEPAEGRIVLADPRLPEAGFRIYARPGFEPAPSAAFEDWDRNRLALGLPDGSRDLEQGRTLLLEAGFDELAGISWTKGCWMGQELTARTRYRGLVKRRLVPVRFDGLPPPPGTAIEAPGEGATEAEAGTIRSGIEGLALAMLRVDALEGRALGMGERHLVPALPDWIRLAGTVNA